MKAYLNKLNEREQWMVLATLLCLAGYLYYLVLYNPIVSKIEQRQTLLIEKKETLAWMNKMQKQKTTTTVKNSVDNGALLTLLATQLKENDSLNFPYQLHQTSTGEIQLTFEQVPFNLFMGWLAQINDKYYISIKQFTANKTTTPGITQLMIILSAVES
jgi:general secretion pathway protein M